MEKDFFEKNGLAWRFAGRFLRRACKKGVIRGMHFQVPPYDHEKIVLRARFGDGCARGFKKEFSDV